MKRQIDLDGPDGNFWFLAAMARQWGQQLELDHKKITKEMRAKDYRHACSVFLNHFGDYVELIKNGAPYDPRN